MKKILLCVIPILILTLEAQAQWVMTGLIINSADELNFSGEKKIMHYSFLEKTLNEYDDNFNFTKEIKIKNFNINEIKQIYIFNDTIYINGTFINSPNRRNLIASFDGGNTFNSDFFLNNIDSFPNGINTLVFFNSKQGFLSASGNLYSTNNACSNWQIQNKYNLNYKFSNNRFPSPLKNGIRLNGNAVDIRISGAPNYDSTFLIYTNDFGKNWYDKLLPKRNYSNGTLKDGASMIFYNALSNGLIGYTNDSANTIIKDTMSSIINFINYCEIDSNFGFYVLSSSNGTFINANADKNWNKIDNLNFGKISFINSYNGFAIEQTSDLNALNVFRFNSDYKVNVNNSIKIKFRFSVYPNPATNKITIDIPNKNLKNYHANIYDYKGSLIKNILLTTNEIDIENLSQGLYMLELINMEENTNIGQQRLMSKFVKE